MGCQTIQTVNHTELCMCRLFWGFTLKQDGCFIKLYNLQVSTSQGVTRKEMMIMTAPPMRKQPMRKKRNLFVSYVSLSLSLCLCLSIHPFNISHVLPHIFWGKCTFSRFTLFYLRGLISFRLLG